MFITPNEARNNLERALQAVKEARTSKDLGSIGFQMHKILNKEENKNFFFPAGGKDKFWKAYAERKAFFAEEEKRNQTSQLELNCDLAPVA